MIGVIQGNSVRPGCLQCHELSAGQRVQVQEIVSGYDVENMTKEDRRSLVSELREAGIRRSPALMRELHSLGLNMRPAELSDEQRIQVQEIVSGYDVENMSRGDKQSLVAELREAGFTRTHGLIGELHSLGINGGAREFTEEQRTQVQAIVSNYDVENLSREDRPSLFMELREAGINRSRELGEELASLGVKIDRVYIDEAV